MKTVTLSKLQNAVGNGLWQLIPSVATLLLSLFVVRLFSASVWGVIVSIIVIQQITNAILSWGNKDFLQRELAENISKFTERFSILFKDRFFLLLLILPILYCCRFIDAVYFFPFSLWVFGRFLQQSFDIIIIKERKFSLAVIIEIITVILQVFGILILHYRNVADITTLLMVFWLPILLKGLLFSILFRSYFVFKKSNALLGQSFFFAMLSLTGLVHSKIDLLLISISLDHDTLGKYQIITGFLWNIQSIALYVSSPYIHNFYRLNADAQKNYATLLNRLGFWVVPIGVIGMTLLLQYAFKITIDWKIILASLVFGMMSFIYLPWIFQINQQKKEYLVLMMNGTGIFVLAGLLMLVKLVYGLTLENTIIIITIHQIFLAFAAFILHKNSKA